MPSTAYDQDAESQTGSHNREFILALETRKLLNTGSDKSWIGQGCFVCLDSPEDGQYAVLVPCIRPTKKRQKILYVVFSDESSDELSNEPEVIHDPKPKYKDIKPWDMACESDTEIWRRLVKTCYEHKGKWKKWIPFYGITDVREVTFRFVGVVDAGKRYPILIEPIDVESIRRACEAIRTEGDLDNLYDYDPDAEKAKERHERLRFQYLLKSCALNPEMAGGLYSLEKGFWQDSCIYDLNLGIQTGP
ncbi:hypothetical protein HD806DRAFT_325564 [Xylariaceae sp. AK1471]|nr:hypothetical protein HD806DRAFT_325564 [Xylariaceae sp. AK1471]